MQTPAPPTTFQTVRLARGSHSSPDNGACVMELASMLAGEPFSDHPACACPVVGAVLRLYNDRLGDDRRQDLYRYASLVVGSRAGEEAERARAQHCLEWVEERRAERGILWRLVHRPARAGQRDPRQQFMRRLEPYLVRVDEARHAQVLALIDELLEIGRCAAPAEPLPGQAPVRELVSA